MLLTTYCYRPRSLRQGNIISRVCLSDFTWGGTSHVLSHMGHLPQSCPPDPKSVVVYTVLWHSLPDLFKLVRLGRILPPSFRWNSWQVSGWPTTVEMMISIGHSEYFAKILQKCRKRHFAHPFVEIEKLWHRNLFVLHLVDCELTKSEIEHGGGTSLVNCGFPLLDQKVEASIQKAHEDGIKE